MTVHLPEELERGIQAQVESGAFASKDDAIAEAVRQFLRNGPPPVGSGIAEEALLRQMLELGLITQLPDKEKDFDDPDDQLIDIEGEPMSQTIIRERG